MGRIGSLALAFLRAHNGNDTAKCHIALKRWGKYRETPQVNDHQPWSADAARAIIAAHAGREGATLPILHALQEAFGCIPEAAEPLVAEALNRTRAEIHGVVTFYHDFRREPPGRHVLKLCRAEACQARGGDALAADVERGLGIPINSTSPDGRVTFEAVYCLGLCALGPAIMIDGKLVARVEPGEGAARVVEACNR
jgi:formate dehydrogenase subunit gamma